MKSTLSPQEFCESKTIQNKRFVFFFFFFNNAIQSCEMQPKQKEDTGRQTSSGFPGHADLTKSCSKIVEGQKKYYS